MSTNRLAVLASMAVIACLLFGTDALAQKPRLTLKGSEEQVSVVHFSSDGKKLLTCCEKEIILWDVSTGKKHASLGKPGAAVALDAMSRFGRLASPNWFSPDGKWLVVLSDPPSVIEVATGKKKFSVAGAKEFTWCFAFSPDGKRLASVVYPDERKKPGSLRFWDVASGKESKELARKMDQELAFQIVYSPDGKSLGLLLLGKPKKAGDEDTRLMRVEILDVQTGKQRHAVEGDSRDKSGWGEVAFSPDSARFTIAGKIYDTKTGKLVVAFARQKDEFRSLQGVRFSPDGKSVLGVMHSGGLFGSSSEARWWDATTGKEQPLTFEPVWLVVSGDGKSLFTGSNVQMIWDVSARKPRRILKNPIEISIHPALSPDGKLLAVGQQNGEIHIYDVPTK